MKTQEEYGIELEPCINGLKEIQVEYLRVMIFLKDIREKLNDAFIDGSYVNEKLIELADLISHSIDGFKDSSKEVSDATFDMSQACEVLEHINSKINKRTDLPKTYLKN